MPNFRPIIFTLAGFTASIASFAQTWTGGAGTGAWGTAQNWSFNTLPSTNAVIAFDGAHANGQRVIDLEDSRTVAGIVFYSAAGVNPFSFSNNSLSVGSSGIVNNDMDAQTFNSNMALLLTADQTWNAANGDININSFIYTGSKNLTLDGSKNITLGGIFIGFGSITKQGTGTTYFNDAAVLQFGPITINNGAIIANIGGDWGTWQNITVNSGLLQLTPGGDFRGFNNDITIAGGATVRVNAAGEIQSLFANCGSLTLGPTGGTLDIASQLAAGTQLGSVIVNSSAATPGVIKYGTIATTGAGWDPAGRGLIVGDGNLSGSGALSFQLSNGAMVSYQQANFDGSLNFTGVSGGSASAGSSAINVGRLVLDSTNTFTVANGVTFDNAMQVMGNGAARTLDANLTINSGTTAFQGGAGATTNTLVIGSTVGGRTLTVKDGATAVLDSRFRNDSAVNSFGGITLNADTTLEAGGSLRFTKSATVSGESIGGITVNGNVTGQGTSAKESTVFLITSVTWASGAGSSGSDLIVNGSGTGGLRIEGTQARVDNLLTTQRLQDITGTGGTLTIAYTDNGTRTISVAPTTGSDVRLGFDAVGASTPTYQLGSAANDLANWGGLVVKGGTVRAMVNESFAGSTGTTSSLDLLGGTLVLNSGAAARTLTFEGGANLMAGTLSGGGTGGSGTLTIGGDLVAGAVTLSSSPNITMNVSGSAAVSGSAISGIGTFAKQGSGTVTIQSGLTATTIDLQSGSLLLGGNNLIGNTTALRLGAGTTFGTGGKSDTLGVLTLAGNSTIDFGSGASVLNFLASSGASWTSGTTLTLANWNGGSDKLMFGSAMSALTAGQVSQIRFLNPNGISGTFGAMILSTGEIVPVPEPATLAMGALLAGGIGVRERRRFASLALKSRALWRKIAGR